jgi:hypothetical protein
MKWHDALGFCLVGLFMLGLPLLAPGCFTAASSSTSDTGKLWIMFMGAVNTSLGSGAFAWKAAKLAWQILEWLPPVALPEAEEVPDTNSLPEPV